MPTLATPPGATASPLDLARQGDPDAFESLVQPHLGMFFRVIDRILGNEAESQDALQEALIAMYRELPNFEGGSAFSTWGYRVCVNQALMHRRKRVRRREDAIEDLLPRFDDDGHHMNEDTFLDWSEEAEAQVNVEHSEIRKRVREGLDRLSDDQRAVFVLRDLEDWDTEDIARHLGISRDLVRQRLHRARLAMRGVLSDFAAHAKPKGGH